MLISMGKGIELLASLDVINIRQDEWELRII